MLGENLIKCTRRMKLIRKSAGSIGDKKVKGMLNKTKPWGGGKNLKITSLPHENPNEFTIHYVTV